MNQISYVSNDERLPELFKAAGLKAARLSEAEARTLSKTADAPAVLVVDVRPHHDLAPWLHRAAEEAAGPRRHARRVDARREVHARGDAGRHQGVPAGAAVSSMPSTRLSAGCVVGDHRERAGPSCGVRRRKGRRRHHHAGRQHRGGRGQDRWCAGAAGGPARHARRRGACSWAPKPDSPCSTRSRTCTRWTSRSSPDWSRSRQCGVHVLASSSRSTPTGGAGRSGSDAARLRGAPLPPDGPGRAAHGPGGARSRWINASTIVLVTSQELSSVRARRGHGGDAAPALRIAAAASGDQPLRQERHGVVEGRRARSSASRSRTSSPATTAWRSRP